MSYILDALRKAERQRHPRSVPTLDTVHAPRGRTRRAWWPWVVAGALALNAAVVTVLWRPAPRPVSPTAVASGPPAASGGATVLAPAPAPEVAGPGAVDRGIERSAPARSAAGSGGPGPRPEAAESRPSAPPPAGDPAATPTARTVTTPPVSPPAAPAPGDEKPAPIKPADPPAAGAPNPLAEAMARMTLDVLVYSERASERMVFINGRKYVEGQTVDGRFLVEGITREGAILSDQGQRSLLRPKSNPYLNP